ncbi:MAG: DUF1080 domain-containing protein, partial [Pirellulales bacterium]|nr:DUF1080 domain-containing protein [Pirellulales bacterium]
MNRHLDGITALLCCLFLPAIARSETPPNQLTDSERRSGWQLLFDGQSAQHWRNYKKDALSDGWQVLDGALVRTGKGAGDIVTKKKYGS